MMEELTFEMARDKMARLESDNARLRGSYREALRQVDFAEAENARLRAALADADAIIRADQRTPINRLYDVAVVVRVALGIVNPH